MYWEMRQDSVKSLEVLRANWLVDAMIGVGVECQGSTPMGVSHSLQINNPVTLHVATTLIEICQGAAPKTPLDKGVLSVTLTILGVNFIGNTTVQPEEFNCYNQQDQP